MGDFVNKLRELNVEDDDCVTLSYTEGAMCGTSMKPCSGECCETERQRDACRPFGIGSSGLRQLWGEVSRGMISSMRCARNGCCLDDYDRGDECLKIISREVAGDHL
jgi:hypothetical protein